MKNLTFAMGMFGAMALSVWACGSDVENGTGGGTSTTTSDGGSGGSGGSGGAASSSSSSSSSSSGSGGAPTCDGPFTTSCEEACCIVETQCGAQGACGLAGQLGYDLVGCGDMVALCAATCIINEPDCGNILALAGGDFNTPLGQCLVACQSTTPCQNCVTQSCAMELQACFGDGTGACPAFLQCAQACGDDIDCINTCGMNNPGTETDNLLTCIGLNCVMDCTP